MKAVADPAGGNDTDLAESIAEKYPGTKHCKAAVFALCQLYMSLK